MAMYTQSPYTSGYYRPSRRFSVRLYYPRVVLALGGVLAAVATAVPWMSAPLVGGVSLWRLHSLVSGLADVVQRLGPSASDTGHAGTVILFLPLGVLLLGIGAVVLGGVTVSHHAARIACAVVGAVTSAAGAVGVAVVMEAAGEAHGVVSASAGAFVLVSSGVVMLSGAFVSAPGGTVHVPPSTTQSLGIAGGALVSAVGAVLLIASLSIVATQGGSSSVSEPSRALERKPAPPTAELPTPDLSTVLPAPQFENAPAPTTPEATTASVGPQHVMQGYFDAINDHDYRRAWELGGKNLDSSYSDFVRGFRSTAYDDWTTTRVDGQIVHGELRAVQTDGSVKVFAGQYRVVDGAIASASVTEN